MVAGEKWLLPLVLWCPEAVACTSECVHAHTHTYKYTSIYMSIQTLGVVLQMPLTPGSGLRCDFHSGFVESGVGKHGYRHNWQEEKRSLSRQSSGNRIKRNKCCRTSLDYMGLAWTTWRPLSLLELHPPRVTIITILMGAAMTIHKRHSRSGFLTFLIGETVPLRVHPLSPAALFQLYGILPQWFHGLRRWQSM